MDKPIEEMSLEEIQAEREKVAAERAALEAAKAAREPLPEGGYVTPGPEVYEPVPPAPPELAVAPDLFAEPEPEEPEAEPEPWPHQHLVHHGLELDVRVPNQNALLAISMLQQLEGLGELQMEVFNTFLANHLSPGSLAKVIIEFTRPDTEMTMQGLVQALVDMRIAETKAS